MKILFLAQLPPPIHGPSQVSKILLNKLNLDKSITVDFINISTTDELNDIGKVKISKLKKFFRNLIKLTYFLFQNNYDLLYMSMSVADNAFFKDSIYLIFSKYFIKRRILHFHSQGLKNKLYNSKFKFLLRNFYAYIFKDCELIHLSKSLLADLNVDYFKSIHIIPNGIIDNYLLKEKHTKQYQILFLSNIINTKGIFILIKALNLIKRKNIKFKACIAGASHCRLTDHKVNKLIKSYDLKENIDLIGPKYDDEKYLLFEKSQIFVLPTMLDCMPLTIIEAMSFNMPIISTKVGAIPEMLDYGKSGLVIPPNNSIKLAEAIVFLLNNANKANDFAKNARFKFERQYTINRFFNDFMQVIKSS